MFRTTTLLLVLLGVIPCPPFAAAQAPETGAADSPAASDRQSAYDAAFDNYKEAMRQIEQRRIDFQVADEAERNEINQNLHALAERAQVAMEELIDAAVALYRQAPGENEEVTKLLKAVAEHYAVGQPLHARTPPSQQTGGKGPVIGHQGGDQFELVLPILEALVEGEPDNKKYPLWALVAAFATNDYDAAQKYYELAQEKGSFADPAIVEDNEQQEFAMLALQYGESIDKYRQMWAKEQEIRAAEAEADDLPHVKFSTNKGDIVLELFENEAPQAVANMITLVKQGYYDGLTFHRVLPRFMAQGGCPEGTGMGGPGYCIPDEHTRPDHRKHFRGSLSMAKTAEPDSGGSQFFLTFVPTGHLDGAHTVFGRVIEGMEVLAQLERRNPVPDPRLNRNLPTPDKIIKAEVLRDRGHEYEFEKLPER